MLLRVVHVPVGFLFTLLSLLLDGLVLVLSLLLFQVEPHEELVEVEVVEISRGKRQLGNDNLDVLLLEFQL
jgi:hypothetical protein